MKPSTPPRWRFLKPFPIKDRATGLLYLWRLYLIETPWFGVMLHRIVRPDHDAELHDHPWSFLSLVLRGGYVEELGYTHPPGRAMLSRGAREKAIVEGSFTLDGRTSRNVHGFSFHRAEDLHRIARLHGDRPAWTLVFTGRRRREWGFRVPGYGWIDWRTFLDVRDMERALDAARAAEELAKK